MAKTRKPQEVRGRFCGVPGAALQYLTDESNRSQVEKFVDAVDPGHNLFPETVRLKTSFGVIAVHPGEWVFRPDDPEVDPVVIRKGTEEAKQFG